MVNHPGAKAYNNWNQARRIISVYRRNTEELLHLIDRVERDQILALELMQNVRDPVVRQEFALTFDQRFFNMSASIHRSWLPIAAVASWPELAKTIKRYQQLILGAVEHGLLGARSEATNTHLRLLTRRSYGLSPSPSWPRPTSPAAACAHPSPAGQPHDHYPQKRQESQPTHLFRSGPQPRTHRASTGSGWVDQRVRTGGVKLLPA